ncbi:MAG TPA: cytochrome c oxidase subunit II, partial [Anaerolineaceae bacterium]|nr:cytochrome c oxidase subunit II [Anaerolineaceae bacterium]
GPASRQISYLGWTMIILGSVIFLIVVAYLLYALFRRREGPAAVSGMRVVVWGGIIIPALILIGLFVFNINVLGAVNPSLIQTTMTVEVIGHQWWWEVRYPDHGFVTANEVRIPAGQPVRLELTSEDVIHSFWVPELHGKMDLNPGSVNDFWIQADEPGEFVGECAEFCGTQHAKMLFRVVSESQQDFDNWVAQMQQPADAPGVGDAAAGMEIFLSANCVQCHAVQGTEAAGEIGPDLTHIASRRTIGAGILPNTPENLLGWIANPHAIKPGVFMPASDLSAEELNDLVAYLLTLE